MYNSIQQELGVINECTKKLDKMFGDEDIIDFGHMGSRGHKKTLLALRRGSTEPAGGRNRQLCTSCIANPVVMNFA